MASLGFGNMSLSCGKKADEKHDEYYSPGAEFNYRADNGEWLDVKVTLMFL